MKQALRSSIKNAISGLQSALKDKESQVKSEMDSLHSDELAKVAKLRHSIQTGGAPLSEATRFPHAL